MTHMWTFVDIWGDLVHFRKFGDTFRMTFVDTAEHLGTFRDISGYL
jgi:hypothetical protein